MKPCSRALLNIYKWFFLCCCDHCVVIEGEGSGGPAELWEQGHHFCIAVDGWESCLNYYKDSYVLLERVPLQFSLRETIKCVRTELLGLSCTSLVNQAWKGYFCLVSSLHLGWICASIKCTNEYPVIILNSFVKLLKAAWTKYQKQLHNLGSSMTRPQISCWGFCVSKGATFAKHFYLFYFGGAWQGFLWGPESALHSSGKCWL